MTRLVDWRDLDSAALADTWVEQRAQWLDQLSWDSTGTWAEVERQRRAGRLPGLALLEDGELAGWAYFLLHEDTLQIGGLGARSSQATRALLDALLALDAAGDVSHGVLLFAFSAAPGLVPALVARGFDVEPYQYMARDLPCPGAAIRGFTWSASAARGIPDLLAASYGQATVTRPFARGDRPEEWRHYVAQLLGGTACGEFAPALSASALSEDGHLDGVVLTTTIAPRSAHIAQVAVAPGRHGQGLASGMLGEVLRRASDAGVERVSLLVSGRNRRARGIYERAGFRETARFVAAGRPAYPRRSTSPAFETGGARILR